MTELATAGRSELHVGWLMPAFFHPLPVDATEPEELTDRIVELARTLLADRSADDQHLFAQLMLRQTVQLIGVEAEYAGMCFVEHEGEPTMATVLVNRVPSLGDTVDEAAEATAALLNRRYRHDDVRARSLPVDDTPAVSRVGGLEVTVPPELSPDGQSQTLPQGVIQTYVPLPGQGETMVFELNSPSREAWDMYVDMFDAILDTLDWATDEELAERRELERISGVPAQLGSQPPTEQELPSRPEPVDPRVAEAVRRHSRLILDVIGMRGPVDEESDRLTAGTCESCRPKGLTSGCTVRHHWEMTRLSPEVLDEMLARARTHLTEGGPATDTTDEGRVTFTTPGDATCAQGYTLLLAADPVRGHLLIDVATSCARATATSVARDFG